MKLLNRQQKKSLSDQAVTTLVNHFIFQLGNSLSSLFINLYLWRLTESLYINGLYNLIAILAQGLSSILIGRITKRKGHLIIYRYGIFLTACFYLCIIIMQEQMIHYFVWFALLIGVAQAAYWLSYFTLAHEVSSNTNRHRYLGWNQILMGLANLVGPAVAGIVISLNSGLTGYIIVFIMAFILFFFATIGSFRLNMELKHHKEYYMKYLSLMIKKKRHFGTSLIGWFIIGFPQGILMYVPSILLFTILPNESFIGYMNVFFLSLSIIASYLLARVAKLDSTKFYLFIAAFGMVCAATFLLWEIAIWSVVLFMTVQSIFRPLQATTYAVYYYSWLDLIPLKDNFRVESVVLREAIINFGRAMGIFIFMIFSTSINLDTIPWILVFVMGIQLYIPVLIKEK
ncbi:MFS transporter [Bacillus suaedae]|uniref:MFS transporter n=1 Tax=Halalkalibacter suaedae TaxID=2822140 RepID=A0A940WY75_9BACI|nr:MFS transporter [Bacillus suaedae]MBP3952863.1 MFS transporter [Bacillus suaedae]